MHAWAGGYGHTEVGTKYGLSLVEQGEAVAKCLVKYNGFRLRVQHKQRLELVMSAPSADKMTSDEITRNCVPEMAREELREVWEVAERTYAMDMMEEAAIERTLLGHLTATAIIHRKE